MVKCKTCAKEYHACMSCGINGYEWDYCSRTCWKQSEDYKRIRKFLDTLSHQQQIDLHELLIDDLDQEIWMEISESQDEES